ncbi:MAG: hypothetical protein D6729_06750, partial [Deltaproteobacteria bacterium]
RADEEAAARRAEQAQRAAVRRIAAEAEAIEAARAAGAARQKEEARRKQEEARQAEEARRREAARREAAARKEAEAGNEAAVNARASGGEAAPPGSGEGERAGSPEDRAAGQKVAALSPTPAGEAGGRCPKGMVYIPAGPFKIGSAVNDPMRNFAERALADVDVPAFCIDRYEYGAYKRVPTTGVTWYRAKELCEKRGRRLCTEEEWEKACKGPRNYRFPYGNVFDPEACNTEDAMGNDRPLAPGATFGKCRSGYGVYDLSGNVAEWTASKFQAGLSDRTMKGGAANRPDWDTRCATRGNRPPNARDKYLGFRCCADPR